MRTVLRIILLTSCGLGLYAQSQGTVVGDDGKPLAAVVQFLPSVATAGGPQSSTSDTGGGFPMPKLAAGDYEVCVQVQGDGYINPCQWPSFKVSLSQTVAAPASPAPLVVKKGSTVKVRVIDSKGLLAASPSQPFLVGVFGPSGAFYLMKIVQSDAAGRVYSITIPFNFKVNMLVSGPGFQLQDGAGATLANAQQSAVLLQAVGAADPVFTVRVTGKN